MFGNFKKLARALKGPTAQEREMAYINEAGDRYDLEYRERRLSRGQFGKQNGYPY